MKVITAILALCACTLSAALPNDDLSSGNVAREIKVVPQGYDDNSGDDVGRWSKRGTGHRSLRKRDYYYNKSRNMWVYAPTSATTITGSNGGAPFRLDQQRAREDAASRVTGKPWRKQKPYTDDWVLLTATQRQKQAQQQANDDDDQDYP